MSTSHAFPFLLREIEGVTQAILLPQISSEYRPDWFISGGLCDLPEQKDEKRLIQMAERLWPCLDWLPADISDRNRGAWYKAVVRQRSTGTGWLMDRGTRAPSWGNVYPIAKVA